MSHLTNTNYIDITKYERMVLKGDEFNRLFNNIDFIKLTNSDEIHNDFQFKDGLNVDIIPFYPHNDCEPGGIYFTNKLYAGRWITYKSIITKYMRKVIIPDNAKVYIEDRHKFKADRLILGPRKLISKDIYISSMKYFTNGLCYIPDEMKDRELYMELVKNNPYALRKVPNNMMDEEIFMLAIRNDTLKFTLKYVPNDLINKELYILAVQFNGKLLEYVPENIIDDEICLAAIKQTEEALIYVPESVKSKLKN